MISKSLSTKTEAPIKASVPRRSTAAAKSTGEQTLVEPYVMDAAEVQAAESAMQRIRPNAAALSSLCMPSESTEPQPKKKRAVKARKVIDRRILKAAKDELRLRKRVERGCARARKKALAAIKKKKAATAMRSAKKKS